jgi:acyl-CoA thioester hydrolase
MTLHLQPIKPEHATTFLQACGLGTTDASFPEIGHPFIGPYYYDVQVPIGETDTYGVAWHGSYTRWLEEARVAMLVALGVSLENAEVLFPVKTLNLTYHRPIRSLQWVRIEVYLIKQGLKLRFQYRLFDLTHPHTANTPVSSEALCDIIPVQKASWRPLRQLPEPLASLFTQAQA